jgi:hypothetical protein
MASAGTVTLNLTGLESLKKEIRKGASRVAQVGIFSDKNARDNGKFGGDITNAEIGLKHEFGSRAENIPERSFLRMPLASKLANEVKAYTGYIFDSIGQPDGFALALQKLGFLGEAIVEEAFDTAGFGSWPANSPMTIALKGRNEPLVDTSQLRHSISSRVVQGGTDGDNPF